MIWSFLHIVCGYVIQVILLYHDPYHAIFLNLLDLVVGEGTHSDFGMFYIALVLCPNYNIQVQGYSNQDLVLYCSGSYIPGL